MVFASQITQVPLAHKSDRGLAALEKLPQLNEDVSALIMGAAGSSAYLSRLFELEHEWLAPVFDRDPSDVFDDILNKIDVSDLSTSLRVAKRRAALLIALADLGGIWSLNQVTGALASLADRALSVALSQLLNDALVHGKLPMCSASDLAVDCGYCAIGMGKHGARELNYSSDIDLIMLFDETRYAPEDHAMVRKVFIRITQQLVKLMQEMTQDGYVFRTDLRLRPDPSVTPVCISMDAALSYYESFGRTWERAAMIKARPVAGDLEAGAKFIRDLQPFIWRKNLDFPAIQDAQDMILKIRDHKGLLGPPEFVGHDIKLGQGGIREIEFYAQSHQLIFGGRERDVRPSRTTEALKALECSKRIPDGRADRLIEAYEAHRMLEHRIQMLNDAQTHEIPKNTEALAELANLCGFADISDLERTTLERIETVHSLTEISRVGETEHKLTPQAAKLSSNLKDLEARWIALPALRSPRAQEIFVKLKPALLNRLSDVSDPAKAMLRFEQFLSGLPSGIQVFSLFDANPLLLDLIVDICAVSPELAEYLGRHNSVLDAVLDVDFFEPVPGFDALAAELDDKLSHAVDYEQSLDAVRAWQKEVHFRNGVHLLRRISTPQEAAQAYSRIADVCINALIPCVAEHLAERFGPPPGRGVAILAMGKLGSMEMTAGSDLDLIVVYDAAGEIETSGPKSLAVGAYYARFTKALIAALTVPTANGSLYEVDMRLRPSGRNGPVATSLSAFADYQLSEAWTWEHLALARARVNAGQSSLRTDVEAAIHAALAKPRDIEKTRHDVVEMREKLADAFPANPERNWQPKHGPGRLLDIDLFVQFGALVHGLTGIRTPVELLVALEREGFVSEQDAETLRQTHNLLSVVQQVERLVGAEFDPVLEGQRAQSILVQSTLYQTVDEILRAIETLSGHSADIISKSLNGASE